MRAGQLLLRAGGAALFVSICCLWVTTATASPLAPPGNSGLRNDVEILADAGVMQGPISIWPLSWPQVAASLSSIPESAHFGPMVTGALARVRAHLRLNKRSSNARAGVYARGGTNPQFLRSFDDTPRAEAEVGVYLDWTAGHFAGHLQLGYAAEPADGHEVRLDGSWLGVVLGNWMLAAGWIDRYWGPAWQGGLILSNNARPRAGLTLRRLRSTPFQSKWLSWIGPWSFTGFVERLGSSRAHPNTLLLGYRLAFKPFQSLEIGLSRTSMLGGEDHYLGLDSFVNAITGFSTSTNSTVGSSKDINSLAGLDMRWKIPGIRTAVYGEIGCEDESGGPTLCMGQGGVEFWGPIGTSQASWRVVLERADTKAHIFNSGETSGYGVAYNNSDYKTGYRYRGRVLGYPADGDALLNSVRVVLQSAEGNTLRVTFTTGEVNRTQGHGATYLRNSLTQRNEQIQALDIGYDQQFSWGRIELGFGFTQRAYDTGDVTNGHAWLGYSREF